jgi:ATP-dependent Clp protease ATP-binding subunit ClpC
MGLKPPFGGEQRRTIKGACNAMTETGDTADDHGSGPGLDRAAAYLVELAKQRAEEMGHAAVSLQHLLLALLERYLDMVDAAAPDVDWQKYRDDLQTRLRGGPPSGDKPLDEVVAAARVLAAAEGVSETRLRHLCSAVLDAIGARSAQATPSEQSSPAGATERAVDTSGRTPTAAGLEEYLRRKPPGASSGTPTLDEYGVDLTEKARRGELPPVVGRDREIDAIIEILCRSYKRNPLLVGPAGVGKTAIVEGLAQRIVAGQVPQELRQARVIMLQPTVVMQGVRTPAELEDRVRAIIEDASKPGILLFIDEFHMIVGAGGIPGINDLAQRLKPALARGDIACIGATTEHEFRAHIQKDRALERRFHPLRIDELDASQTLEIVERLATRWENERGVRVERTLLSEIIDLSDRYIRNRRFPDKAIELLDTAIAAAQAACRDSLDLQTVHRVISNLIGAPIGDDEHQLAAKLQTLEEHLNSTVLGQPEAASLVATALSVTMRGFDLNPQRPNGVFLFAGPPGVGKSSMAREIARYLFNSPDKILELEMSEYQDHHTVYRLIGAPPGYVGFDEGGKLEWVNDNPYSVVVLDNIEHAHPNVLALFVQIFSSGTISTMRGERIIFSDVIFVMTCDLPTRRQATVGFGQATPDEDLERRLRQVVSEDILQCVDAVCPFYPLSEDTVHAIIAHIFLPQVREKAQERGLRLDIAEEVVKHLASLGFSPTQGASRLGRVVETCLMRPILQAADKSHAAGHQVGTHLAVRVQDGQIVVEVRP